jgi:hypothetical protein
MYAFYRLKLKGKTGVTKASQEDANAKCRECLESVTSTPTDLLATATVVGEKVIPFVSGDRTNERDTRLSEISAWFLKTYGGNLLRLAISEEERKFFRRVLVAIRGERGAIVTADGVCPDGVPTRVWWALWRKISNRVHARKSEQTRVQIRQASEQAQARAQLEISMLDEQRKLLEQNMYRADRELSFTDCLIPIDWYVAHCFPYLAVTWFDLRQEIRRGQIGTDEIIAKLRPPQQGSMIAGVPGLLMYRAVLPLVRATVRHIVGDGLATQPFVFVKTAVGGSVAPL